MLTTHGGNPFSLDIELDFSANLNPLGMPESVRKAIIASAESWERYPDPFCMELRKKLAEYESVSTENIVCGNGADDLIYRIATALKPENALICAPSFGEYRKALLENGCTVREHLLLEEDGFALTESILDEISPLLDIVFICSPNNPDGRTVSPELLRKIAEKCLDEGVFLACDESFLDFTGESERLSAKQCTYPTIIILRSFTKLYAMAGLRLGYAVFGDKSIAEKVGGTGQFWSVSAPAQHAGIAALDEHKYVKKSVKFVRAERKYLTEKLTEFGIKVYESEANFLLIRCHQPLDKLLLREKIMIRSCADYSGLGSDFFRIAVRTREENERLVAALRRVLIG